MATKVTLVDRSSAPFGSFPLEQRNPAAKSSFCKIVVFHYLNQNFGQPTGAGSNRPEVGYEKMTEVEQIFITSDIASVSIDKQINNPSATFQIQLLPSRNWRAKIFPGDWLGIYLYPDYQESKEFLDTKNLVLLGNVDRVAKSLSRDEESDKLTLMYSVSGRNFGKIFETTDVWFDPYVAQEKIVDTLLINEGLPLSGSPNQQAMGILNVFLGGGGEGLKNLPVDEWESAGNDPAMKTSPLKQWVIPEELSQLVGIEGSKTLSSEEIIFFDILSINMGKLPGFNVRNSITLESNGSVWEMLQRSINPLVNEMYLEEVRLQDGSVRPSFILQPRPIQTPFFEQQFGAANSGIIDLLDEAHKSLFDLSFENFVEISQGEIIYEDLGKDDHSRFNMWLLYPRAKTDYLHSIMSSLNTSGLIGNPLVNRESVMRHGLRRFDQLMEYVHPTETAAKSVPEIKLLKAFLVQLYDMHFANHLYEAGTLECTGILEAELGKCLVVQSGFDEASKIYYIEGYRHEFVYPNTWKTIFTLTHGQFRDQEKPFIDASDGDFGRPDRLSEEYYKSGTVAKRAKNLTGPF